MKILITSPTFVKSLEGPQFADAPSFADVPKDEGDAIVRAGRAQYVNSKDDPSKLKAFTASEGFVKALEDAIAAEAAEAKKGAKAAEKAAA